MTRAPRRPTRPIVAVVEPSPEPTIAIPRRAITELSAAQLRLLAAIVDASSADGRCFTTLAQLAQALPDRPSRGTIAAHMRHLIGLAYVSRDALGTLHLCWSTDDLRESVAQVARVSRANTRSRESVAQDARVSRAGCASESRNTPPLWGGVGEGSPSDAGPVPLCITCGATPALPHRTVCADCTPRLPAEYVAIRQNRDAVGAGFIGVTGPRTRLDL